jgi:hypothetical protein
MVCLYFTKIKPSILKQTNKTKECACATPWGKSSYFNKNQARLFFVFLLLPLPFAFAKAKEGIEQR